MIPMPESTVLTLAFLEAHPDDAARVLEHLANEQVAALLESVPVRLAGLIQAGLKQHRISWVSIPADAAPVPERQN